MTNTNEMVELCEISVTAEMLKNLIYDLVNNYFKTVEADKFFEYNYTAIQTQIHACCFIAQSVSDMLISVENCTIVEERK